MNSKSRNEFSKQKRKRDSDSEEEVEAVNNDKAENSDSDVSIDKKKLKIKRVEVEQVKKASPLEDDVLRGKDEISVLLNDKKRVSIRKFQGKTYVDFREFYEKDGLWLPGKKGISFTPDLWEKIKKHSGTIDDAIKSINK